MLKTITRKTLLYKSKVEYADYALNHIEGCSHGCKFPCYAMTKEIRFSKITREDWLQPKIVANALELLEKEIPKLKDKIKSVHLCFSTDPFMYQQKEVCDSTLKIIERLNRDNLKCITITKGIHPQELLNKSIYSADNEYGITLISLNDEFKNNYEPGAAPYSDRIKALKVLHDNGLKTWVSMEPYPTPNIVEQDLSKILESVKFVDKIIFGKLNYNPEVKAFPNNVAFYNDCVDRVIKFCHENKIDYYIKNSTKKIDNSKIIKN